MVDCHIGIGLTCARNGPMAAHPGVNRIMYVRGTGRQWRDVPTDLPPRSTLHDDLGRWNDDGTLESIHHTLYVRCREHVAREASPTACVIGSQSGKSAEKGGAASIRTAMTRARRSKAGSGISWSTR
jgi:transposase